jgi:hypothetical protein
MRQRNQAFLDDFRLEESVGGRGIPVERIWEWHSGDRRFDPVPFFVTWVYSMYRRIDLTVLPSVVLFWRNGGTLAVPPDRW